TDASGYYTLAFNETSPGSTHVVEPFVHAGYTKLGPAFPGSYLTVTGLANGTTTTIPDATPLILNRNGTIAGTVSGAAGTRDGATIYLDYSSPWAQCNGANTWTCFYGYTNAGSYHVESTSNADGSYTLSAP